VATNILDATLGEWAGKGYQLIEEADHIVELRFKDKLLAYFTFHVSVEEVRRICHNDWDSRTSLVYF
jgi:hypothetical protein